MSIPAMLLYIKRKKNVKTAHSFLSTLFSAFIISCGLTHFCAALAFFISYVYFFWFIFSLVTAVISLVTAYFLYTMLDFLVQMKTPDEAELISKRYEAVKNATIESIIIFDRKGEVIEWNKGAERMFGYTEKEILGTNLLNVMLREDQDKGREVLFNMKEGKPAYELGLLKELTLIKKNGTTFDASLTVTEVPLENAKIYSIIIRDVSARANIERERNALLEVMDVRLKALEQFNFMVVHDLNAPLRAIDGFSEILENDYGFLLGDEGLNYTKRIRASAVRMKTLIGDILRLSQITNPKLEIKVEEFNISDLVDSICYILGQINPKRDVVVKIQPGLKVIGDESLIRILLDNILGNAWKFTSKKDKALIEFGANKNGLETIFFIKDNGAGFDIKNVDKLFQPFSRLHSQKDFEGNGIGLTIVKRIVILHGGNVWAEGEVGKGAIFYFTLRRDNAGN